MDLNLLERDLNTIDQLVGKCSPNTLTLLVALIQQVNAGPEGETITLEDISKLYFLIGKQPQPIQRLIARLVVNKIEKEIG